MIYLYKVPITWISIYFYLHQFSSIFKGIDHCPVEIIKGLTDKGQFQYLTNLKGPQVGNYL